ncbi:DDT domain-containing protein DDB [Sesamum angolense]|uniref:DDT domain-containing protein DDB n=1 Tax=Sesamum angolense TaxID=2727404 RepID=A0AAE2BQ72_9LAMI|nr:DDT domain-containing protein DDB [Sesamum angolense]
MPLYKRKPFALVEKPEDLKPQELVFQIRFTKEIFRSYNEYLKRINLYRKRVWTCKATGKGNLTYEEALVSEDKASKRIQNIPTQYIAPVLRDVQFTVICRVMIAITEIDNKNLSIKCVIQVDASICGKVNVLHAEFKRSGQFNCCKVTRQYEIAWLDSDHKRSGKALVNGDELTGKNPPFSKRVLKSFIKDSTYRIAMIREENSGNGDGCGGWVSSLLFFLLCLLNKNPEDHSIRYPIEDLLVRPTEEDRLLMERPSPCRDFSVPMDYVGDALMVWDFCASFGRLLNLSPFSLEDFENSLCYKDATPLLIVESYSALLRLLVKDNGKFAMTIEKKKRKPKRGHYGLLEIRVKLAIFRELVAQALETDTIKDKLDEYIEERQALAATRRDEALDEGRKRREEKERRKSEATGKEVKEERQVKSGEGIHSIANEVTPDKSDGKVLSQQNHSSRNSENEGDGTSKKNAKKQKKEFLEREIEKRFIRTSPLGKDKNYCRYWFFRRDGRIFVESSDSTQWGYYQTKEELDALIGSLNAKGVRERALKKQMQKFYNKICSELQKRSKEETQQIEMEEALVRRSTRVRAPPRENPALAFLKYVNKWKEL